MINPTTMNNTIYPCIWCNNNAKEMAVYYCETFPDTNILVENPYVIMLEISGQKVMLLNGGELDGKRYLSEATCRLFIDSSLNGK